jgi:hypothetical protein
VVAVRGRLGQDGTAGRTRESARRQEVVTVSIVNLVRRERRALAYWSQWVLLELFGPAT